jgi:peptidoglycan/xylan/chitin deacetylase (PgdA/CDA1 family)
MPLRPIAVSVVLAAALLGTVVLHDGGAGVLDGPVAASTPTQAPAPSESPGTTASSGSPAPAASETPAGSPDSVASPDVIGSPAATPSSTPGAGAPSPGTAADGFAVWRHGAPTAKRVALTFDDGWNLEHTQQIFAILQAKHAPATFFPVGRAVLRHPLTWHRIAAAGFPIGNHSWNHDDLSKLTAAKAQADMTKSRTAIERTIGVPAFAAVRPPYGAYDQTFLDAAQAAGMKGVILWNLDTDDWTGITPRKVVRAALKAGRGSIIVMHTDKSNTVKALPRIIDGLRARGFTLVTVGELIGLPGAIPSFGDRNLREYLPGR